MAGNEPVPCPPTVAKLLVKAHIERNLLGRESLLL